MSRWALIFVATLLAGKVLSDYDRKLLKNDRLEAQRREQEMKQQRQQQQEKTLAPHERMKEEMKKNPKLY